MASREQSAREACSLIATEELNPAKHHVTDLGSGCSPTQASEEVVAWLSV